MAVYEGLSVRNALFDRVHLLICILCKIRELVMINVLCISYIVIEQDQKHRNTRYKISRKITLQMVKMTKYFPFCRG